MAGDYMECVDEKVRDLRETVSMAMQRERRMGNFYMSCMPMCETASKKDWEKYDAIYKLNKLGDPVPPSRSLSAVSAECCMCRSMWPSGKPNEMTVVNQLLSGELYEELGFISERRQFGNLPYCVCV